jgi:hypothetical protein
METMEAATSELAAIEAMLAGTDQPVAFEPFEETDDDFAVAAPPQSVQVAEVVEAVADPGVIEFEDSELLAEIFTASELAVLCEELEEAPSPAPPITMERKDRVSAFVDRIAEDRARTMLGESFFPVVAAMSDAPKKVAEKVYNALCHVAGRGKLSNYTEIGIKALRENPSRLVSGDLIDRFMYAGYTESTARSQANQQMSALVILGIATKLDGALILNPESVVMALLDKRPVPESMNVVQQSDDGEDLLAAIMTADEDEELLGG